MTPVVMRLSAMGRFNLLFIYGFCAFFLPILALAVPTIPGKIAAVLAALVFDYALIQLGRRGVDRIQATLTDDELRVCNKTLGRVAFYVPWSEVAAIERRWKYFGSPLGSLRGMMLYVSPRPDVGWRPFYVFASYGARSRVCKVVLPVLSEKSAAYGFSLSPKIGTSYGFTRSRRERRS